MPAPKCAHGGIMKQHGQCLLNYTVFKRIRATDTKKGTTNSTRVAKLVGAKKFATLEPGASQNFLSASYAATDSSVVTKQKSKGSSKGKRKGKSKTSSTEKRVSEEIMGIHIEVSVNGASATSKNTTKSEPLPGKRGESIHE